jgi:hypothetical protein
MTRSETMRPNSVGRLSSPAAIRELTAALELTDRYLVARAGQRALATCFVKAGGLDVVDMHKNIGATIIRQDEAKSAICVEELHPASWHAVKPIQRTVSPRPASFDYLVGAEQNRLRNGDP